DRPAAGLAAEEEEEVQEQRHTQQPGKADQVGYGEHIPGAPLPLGYRVLRLGLRRLHRAPRSPGPNIPSGGHASRWMLTRRRPGGTKACLGDWCLVFARQACHLTGPFADTPRRATRNLVHMAFRGWPAEALEFYEGLEADNSKAYWTAHKAVYEERVRRPMAELLDELSAEFGPGKIFRPNRDVRFSADKSPYKTSIAATLERGGYVQLSAHGLAAGRGIYVMASDQLA